MDSKQMNIAHLEDYLKLEEKYDKMLNFWAGRRIQDPSYSTICIYDKGLTDADMPLLDFFIQKWRSNVTDLRFYRDRLTTVPVFRSLPHLKSLSLYDCQISQVPDLSGYPELESLCLEKNQIKDLPDFSHLNRLKILHLKENQLTQIPNFTGLPALEKLDLTENRLTTIPDFSACPNLKRVEIDWNRIQQIPDRLKRLIYSDSLYKQRGDSWNDEIEEILQRFVDDDVIRERFLYLAKKYDDPSQ